MTYTISHELVHQWFGNSVTMDWWDDLWLNEGFASYYELKGVYLINEPETDEFGPIDTQILDLTQSAMVYDITPATHPIHYTASTENGLNVRFTRIVYQKAGAVIRMMEAALGESVWKAGLVHYLKKLLVS